MKASSDNPSFKRALKLGLGKKPDADIARALGLSRERIRQFRALAGMKSPTRERARMRREAIKVLAAQGLCGAEVGRRLGLARGTVCRAHKGVAFGTQGTLHQPDPDAWFRNVDWTLNNTDIAKKTGQRLQYVASVRYLIRKGVFPWNGPPVPRSPRTPRRRKHPRKTLGRE